MKRSSYIIIISIILSQVGLAGGGWPQPKGSGYFKLSEYWLFADEHYTDQGLLDPNLTIGFFSTSLYGEYGVTDRLTAQFFAPFFVRNIFYDQVSAATGETFIEGEGINGVGDFDLTLKYGLTKPGSRVAISAGVTLGLPLGRTTGSSLQNLQLGDGEFNVISRVDVGTSWELGYEGLPMYLNVYGAFNNRTNDFSDEVRVGAEIGAQFFDKKLLLSGKLDVIESLRNGIPSGLNSGASLFANNAEISTVTVELAYNIQENWGISVSTARPFRGENIFSAPAYSVGVHLTI